jgi:hypothetical protein
MRITLHSSVGPFDEGFLLQILRIERMMVGHGLDPSRFVIAKDRSVLGKARPFGTRLWDYTVFVDGEHFTVTSPNDASFLGDFIACWIAPDEAPALPPPGTLLTRVKRWFAEAM